MPMPNSTMNRITEIELSALRPNTLLAVAMMPFALVPTSATVRIGSRQAMTLRKISASRTTISTRVTTLTTASAFSDDSCESSDCAAGPVTPERRSVPPSCAPTSVRSLRASSIAAGSKAFLSGLTWTNTAPISPFAETGTGVAVPRLS